MLRHGGDPLVWRSFDAAWKATAVALGMVAVVDLMRVFVLEVIDWMPMIRFTVIGAVLGRLWSSAHRDGSKVGAFGTGGHQRRLAGSSVSGQTRVGLAGVVVAGAQLSWPSGGSAGIG